MAYGLKYWFQFDDTHPLTKATWKVDISFKDYTGASTEIEHLGASPLTFIRGTQSDDKFEPILGSEADMTIVITDESVIKPDDFIFIDEDAALVEIYKNTVLYWKGFIKQDFIQFAYTAPPYEFTIPATDRIALMKSQLLDIQDEINDDGFVLLSDLLLSKGLYKTNLCSQAKLLSSLTAPSPTGIVYPDTGGKQLSFLDQLKIRFEVLMDSSGNPMNVYDTLVMMARSFGGRIFYNNGYYHFQRIVDMFTEKPLVAVYTDQDYPDSRAAVAIRKTLKGEISSADGIYANNDAYFQIEGAHKQEKLDLDYVLRGYLLNAAWADYEILTGTLKYFPNWNAITSVGNFWTAISQHGTGTIDDPYRCFFKPDTEETATLEQHISGIKQGQAYTLQFKAKFFGVQKFAYEVHLYHDEVGTDELGHYYFDGSIWQQATKSYGDSQYHLFVNRPDDTRKNEVDVNITLPRIPVAYNTIVGPVDPNIIQIVFIDPDGDIDDGSDPKGVEIYPVLLGTNPNGYTGETDTVRSSANYSILNESDDGKIIDALDAFSNAIHYATYGVFSSDNGYWTDDFFNDTTLKAFLDANYPPSLFSAIARAIVEAELKYETIQRRTLREALNESGKPSYNLTTSVFSNTLEFENVIQQAYGNFPVYAQMSDEYDVKNCLHKLQLLQLVSAAGYTGTPKTKFKF